MPRYLKSIQDRSLSTLCNIAFPYKCANYSEDELTAEIEEKLWNETVQQNVFIICKTPMAKSITRRTLVGFKDVPINSHYFDDLINMLKNKPKQFINRVKKPSYWKIKGEKEMKFDAIVGNPPYQIVMAVMVIVLNQYIIFLSNRQRHLTLSIYL